MSEQKLLTESQISRRKTAAIWLIGVGLFVSYFSFVIDNWMRNNWENQIWEFKQFADYHSILLLVNCLIVNLFMICGLFVIRRFADRSAALWVKHWIVVYILYLLTGTVGAYFFWPMIWKMFPEAADLWAIHLNIDTLITMIIFFYSFWAVNIVQVNCRDVAVCRNDRMVQYAIVLSLLIYIVGICLNIQYYLADAAKPERHGWTEDSSFWYIAKRWWWDQIFNKGNIVIFFMTLIGVKNLIRSSLFYSDASQSAAIAEQPKPRISFFSSPVYGAMAAVMFYSGGVYLLTTYWNNIYNNIF